MPRPMDRGRSRDATPDSPLPPPYRGRAQPPRYDSVAQPPNRGRTHTATVALPTIAEEASRQRSGEIRVVSEKREKGFVLVYSIRVLPVEMKGGIKH